jgi:hypothetical protein
MRRSKLSQEALIVEMAHAPAESTNTA